MPKARSDIMSSCHPDETPDASCIQTRHIF